MKEKLMNLVIDPNIQVREVEDFTVSKYAQSMRAGNVFPPLIIEEGTNRIICGNHRYTAYKRVYQPDYSVDVTTMKFGSEAELIRFAARDNAIHGKPMGTWDMKRVAIRLKELGDNHELIAETLSVPIEKVKKWEGMTVVVIGNGNTKFTAPVKNGLEHIAGIRVQEKDYDAHKSHDPGVPIKNMAAVISRHIQNGWVNVNDKKTLENLSELNTALNGFFERMDAA